MNSRTGAAWLSILFTLSACSGDEANVNPFRTCEVDQNLVTVDTCVTDDHCPCATHCDLGTCGADCRSNEECAGGVCDSFGRCRAVGDVSTTPLPPALQPGRLTLSTNLVRFQAPGVERVVRLTALERPVGSIRVVAPAGYSVACSGTDFGSGCGLAGIAVNDERRLRVRLDAEMGAVQTEQLGIFHGPDRYAVSLEARAPSVANARRGAYVGSVKLEAMGIAPEGSPLPRGTVARVDPVTAKLFVDEAGSGVVVVDGVDMINAGGQLIGSIDVPAGETRGTITWRAFRAVEADVALAGLPTDVVAHATSVEAVFAGTGPTLSFPLEISYAGIGESGAVPRVAYRVMLTRREALDDDETPPDLPVAVEDPSSPRRDVASAWETATFEGLQSVLGGTAACGNGGITCDDGLVCAGSAGCVFESGAAREVNGFFGRGGQDFGFLNTCDPSDRAAMIDEATESIYRAVYGAPPLNPADVTKPLVVAVLDAAGIDPSATTESVIASLTSSGPIQGSIPCQIAPNPFTGFGRPLDMGVIDICDDVAREFSCTVRRVPDGDVANGATVTFFLSDAQPRACSTNTQCPGTQICSASFCIDPKTVPTDVQRVCTFERPVGALACAEMGLCWEAPVVDVGVDHNSTRAPLLTETTDATGDLTCATGSSRSAGLVDARGDGLFAVLLACMNELELARDQDVTTSGFDGTNGTRLEQVFGSANCLDPGRFAFALGHATAPARAPNLGALTPRDVASLKLAHRLLQNWLTLHGLVAREALQYEPLRDVIQLSEPGEPAPADVDPEAALDESLRGWHLLLHPRFFGALEALPDAVVYDPDYRPASAAATASDAQLSVAVLMIETLDAQAALLERLLKRGHRRGELDIVAKLNEFRRLEAVVRSIAEGLLHRAQRHAATTGAPAPWFDRYFASANAYEGTTRDLVRAARDIDQDRNPLGIQDSDLPLYFLGDESTSSKRFTAISTFLLGKAQDAVVLAFETRGTRTTGARGAGLAKQQRMFEQALEGADFDRRISDIADRFGNTVVNYCGRPNGSDGQPLPVQDIVTAWPGTFSANDCFIRSEDPACLVPVEAYEEAMELDDVKYQFCVARELRALTGGAIGFADGTYDGVAEELTTCPNLKFPAECPPGVSGPCASCDWSPSLREKIVDSVVGIATTAAGAIVANAGNPLAVAGSIVSYCRDNPDDVACSCAKNAGEPSCGNVPVPPSVFQALGGLTATPPELLAEAKETCQSAFPGARENLPGGADLPGRPTTKRECYDGSIGQSALELQGIATDLDIARSEMADLHDAYDVAIRSCLIQQGGNALLEDTRANHNRTMSALRRQKATADEIAAGADAAEDCLDTLSGVTPNPFSIISAGVGCIAGAVGGASEVNSAEIAFEMDEAEASHEALMASIANDIQEQLCFNDAEQHLVETRTRALRVQGAALDLDVALYQFEQAKSAAQTAFDEGRAALAIAQSRRIQPPAHDFWFDAEVERYLAKMRIARRRVYLAVRAVEYEFQESNKLGTRADTLKADTPEELEAVLDRLDDIASTGDINGNKPTDLKIVLSLRRNLLQLGDLSQTQPAGWHRLTDIERFRLLLRSPRFAAYDEAGAYTGQRIPFSIAPLAAFGLGEVQGIPIFASGDCAERLWDVNASVLGENLHRGDSPTFVRIDLVKSNTFFSQWCTPQDTPFQQASVRPSRNLFREPGDDVDDDSLSARGGDQETRARIEAYFNIDRTEFERDDFSDGSTSELASRGLYGEYALFIGAEFIARSPDDDGLLIDNVDDILLRLDYNSVAK